MPRIYYPDLKADITTLTLPERQAQHIRVLRLNSGGEITLFNGKGHQCKANLSKIGKKSVEVQCHSYEKPAASKTFPVHLAMSLINREQMDWVIQKSVELGVREITPIIAERTQGRLNIEQVQKRLHHWQEIIIASAEQSGCNFLPRLQSPLPFEMFCTQANLSLKLILDPYAEKLLHDLKADCKDTTLLIGPEGGFTPREVEFAKSYGYHGVCLHEQILRAETAAVSSIAITQFYFSAK